jgi:hypothetical protein
LRVAQPETARKPTGEGRQSRHAPAHMVHMHVVRTVLAVIIVGRLSKLLGKGCGRLSTKLHASQPQSPTGSLTRLLLSFFLSATLLGPDTPHPLWQTHIASVTSAVVSFLGIHRDDASACHELLGVLSVAVRFVEDKVRLDCRCFYSGYCFVLCVWWRWCGCGGGWL